MAVDHPWAEGVFQLKIAGFFAGGVLKAAIALAWLFSAPASAAGGYVYDAVGNVSIAIGKNAAHPAAKNDAIASDTVVNTGDKSYAVLKFEDGQVATMQANTAFRVREYRYDPNLAGKNNIVFSKFIGGMRFITGLIGQRDHKAFRLSTPNATIGIRGTEFVLVTVNGSLYSQVISGSISMTNAAGMVIFKAGQTILVKSPRTLPMVIPAAALPQGIFSQLDAIPTPPATPAPVPQASAPAIESAVTSTAISAAALLAGTPSAIPLPSGAIPLPSGAIPLPSGAVPLAEAAPLPSGAAPLPAEVVPLPSGSMPLAEAAPLPSGAAPLPAEAVPLPSGSMPLAEAAPLPSGAAPFPSEAVPTAAATPAPAPSARTISITGSGATYTGADQLCDFCTGRTKTVATHVDSNAAAGGPVTGEAGLFGMHNLTTTGANTGEICAFCHTPQGAEDMVFAPRWSRTLTTLGSYSAYSSLGSATEQASASISMSCLSCHDGGQAPNIVINTPGLRLNVGNIEVFIGNDLKNHHPVGIQYAGGGQNQYAPDTPLSPVAAFDRLTHFNDFATGNKFSPFPSRNGFFNSRDSDAFSDTLPFSNEGDYNSTKGGFNRSTYSGTGSGTVWWVTPPGSKKKGRQKTDLYLFTRTDTIDSIPGESILNRPYVECATCHDPHSTNSTFLRPPGGNARSQICLACHNK
jgi:predicted CXXCH cytochrome family protein